MKDKEGVRRPNHVYDIYFLAILKLFCVEITGVDPKRLKTSALIRRKQAGLPLEDKEYVPLIERGPRVWMGVPLDQLVQIDRPTKPQLSGAVTSTKTTLGHQSTVDARNKAFEVTNLSNNLYEEPDTIKQYY